MESAVTCPACGRPAAFDARFCAACGAPLGPAPREQRKVVTALFADVVGSTALGERLDPEDLQAVVGEAVSRIVTVVEDLGGTIDNLAGDGGMALFGAPATHEDDPERGVLAGLRVIDAIRAFAAEVASGWEIEGFAVRVGVETGLVVLAPTGTGRSGAMGDALNTAARLQAAARPGTVLAGPRTVALTEPLFVWGEPLPLDLRGKAEQVIAREAIAPRRGVRIRRGLEGVRTELVGRERELTLGRGVLEDALEGQGGVLFVSGEAGLGKTRLIEELRARWTAPSAGDDGALWLEGRCVSYGDRLPFLPFQLMLRRWLGAEDRAEHEVADALRTRLEELLPERAGALAPLLGAVLGVPAAPADAARLAGLHPDDVQRRTFDAVGELVERLARDRPVALVLDDLHWADGTSALLVEHLLPLSEDASVLLLLAARPDRERPAWRIRERALRELPQRTRSVELEALAGHADRELLGALIGVGTLPPELEGRVLERAEGNPLYLEELVRSLVEMDALVREGDSWRLARPAQVDIPETVEKLLLARVDRLPPSCREVLAGAAVLGRRFDLPLLEAVVELDGGTQAALNELVRLDLVREGGRGAEPSYRFKHSLIQEATYRSMLKRRRLELHRRAAEAIEAGLTGPPEERLGVLAYHYGAAGEHERALDYHARAAAAAEAIHAFDESLDHLTAGLEGAGELGLDATDPRVCRLLIARGQLAWQTEPLDVEQSDLAVALAGARAAGDPRLELDALRALTFFRQADPEQAIAHHEAAVALAESLGDLREWVSALARLSILHANHLHLDMAGDYGQRALALAHERGADELIALDALKLSALYLGDLARLEELCERLVSGFRGNDLLYESWAVLESAYVHAGRGELDTALKRTDEALELNRAHGDRNNRSIFLSIGAEVLRCKGDYAAALEEAGGALALALEVGGREWIGWTAATLGWTLLELGAAERAAPALEQGRDAVAGSGAQAQIIRCTGLLAQAEWMRGESGRALALADQAEELLAEVTAPAGGAWLFGAHAQLAVAAVRLESGDAAAAARLAGPLAESAAASGWLEPQAGAALVLARAASAAGRTEEAAEHAGGALEAALRGSLPGVAWRAHATLAELHRERGREAAADRHGGAAAELSTQIAAGLPEEELRRAFARLTAAAE